MGQSSGLSPGIPRPCPFCGSHELGVHRDEHGSLYVRCDSDGCVGIVGPKATASLEAWELWNEYSPGLVKKRFWAPPGWRTVILLNDPVEEVTGSSSVLAHELLGLPHYIGPAEQ